jgi:hypothetical protein
MDLQEAFERKWIVHWYEVVTSDAFLDMVNRRRNHLKCVFRWNSFMFKYADLFPDIEFCISSGNHNKYCPNLTMDMVLKQEYGWNWDEISRHPNITMQNILDNQHLPWNWEYVAQNPNLTIDVLHNFPHDIRIWENISKCPNLTMQWVLKYPSKLWDWRFIVTKKGITLEDIENYEWLHERWHNVAFNPNLTMEFVIKHMDKPLYWNKISRHPNITMNDINNNPNLPWVWENVGANPNLTFEMIAKNPNKPWYFGDVLKNEFATDRNIFIDNEFAILLISTIHEFYQQDCVCRGIPFTIVERVFFDEYLMKLIAKHFHHLTTDGLFRLQTVF